MSDSFNTTVAISYVDADTSVTTRFINEALSAIPEGYISGKKTLAASAADVVLCTAQNYVFLVANAAITYKINSGGDAQTGATAFLHNGDAVDIIVTNPSTTTSVTIDYVAMTTA